MKNMTLAWAIHQAWGHTYMVNNTAFWKLNKWNHRRLNDSITDTLDHQWVSIKQLRLWVVEKHKHPSPYCQCPKNSHKRWTWLWLHQQSLSVVMCHISPAWRSEWPRQTRQGTGSQRPGVGSSHSTDCSLLRGNCESSGFLALDEISLQNSPLQS